MDVGFLRKIRDGIVNIGKKIGGGVKKAVDFVQKHQDIIQKGATMINPKFGDIVKRGIDGMGTIGNRIQPILKN